MPEDWQEELSDEQLQKHLKSLKERERIEQVLKHQAFQQAEAAYRKLMKKHGLDPEKPGSASTGFAQSASS